GAVAEEMGIDGMAKVPRRDLDDAFRQGLRPKGRAIPADPERVAVMGLRPAAGAGKEKGAVGFEIAVDWGRQGIRQVQLVKPPVLDLVALEDGAVVLIETDDVAVDLKVPEVADAEGPGDEHGEREAIAIKLQ